MSLKYICIYICVNAWCFYPKKELVTQGVSPLYCSSCSMDVFSFSKGIREAVTTTNSLSERLKALWGCYQLVGNVDMKLPSVYIQFPQFCFNVKMTEVYNHGEKGGQIGGTWCKKQRGWGRGAPRDGPELAFALVSTCVVARTSRGFISCSEGELRILSPGFLPLQCVLVWLWPELAVSLLWSRFSRCLPGCARLVQRIKELSRFVSLKLSPLPSKYLKCNLV